MNDPYNRIVNMKFFLLKYILNFAPKLSAHENKRKLFYRIYRSGRFEFLKHVTKY